MFLPIDKIPKISPDSSKVPPQISKIFQVKMMWDFNRVSTANKTYISKLLNVIAMLKQLSHSSHNLCFHQLTFSFLSSFAFPELQNL